MTPAADPAAHPVRPRRRDNESYVRRLARANHLRPSYLRAYLCDPPRRTGTIRPWRLAALSGRAVRALEHALADLAPQPGPPPRPPARHPRAPGSVRPLISTWILTEPGLTRMQIWERLLDGTNEGRYTTVCHYRSTISSHYRRSSAFRAGIDDIAG